MENISSETLAENESKPPDAVEAMDTPQGHQQFIKSQWKDFAAFAWKRYQAKGRGAVVVDLRRAADAGRGFNVPTFYVADEGKKLEKRGGWPNEEVARAVREYDPEEEVLFVFLRLNGEVFYYIASDDLAPPEACQ